MEKSLLELKEEAVATISRLDGGGEFKRKLHSIGIREGKRIKIVAIHWLKGPVVVEVDGRETTIGRHMAEKIFVEVDS